jgi:hypothetical protein
MVEGNRIVNWHSPQFGIHAVKPDGSLEYDLVGAIAGLEAYNTDAQAKSLGVVGINRAIRDRVRKNPADQISPELQRAAFERATIQILDRLHGVKAAGVRIYD